MLGRGRGRFVKTDTRASHLRRLCWGVLSRPNANRLYVERCYWFGQSFVGLSWLTILPHAHATMVLGCNPTGVKIAGTDWTGDGKFKITNNFMMDPDDDTRFKFWSQTFDKKYFALVREHVDDADGLAKRAKMASCQAFAEATKKMSDQLQDAVSMFTLEIDPLRICRLHTYSTAPPHSTAHTHTHTHARARAHTQPGAWRWLYRRYRSTVITGRPGMPYAE